ncbi:MAG: hypothetical protein Q9209_000975 [Squamulea sp. 1 TL-2023]
MAQKRNGDLDGYPLQRELFSSVRLYLQHWMWRRELGYVLHPEIPVKEGMRIADVACGNCAWLVDAAREHPTAQFDGFDLSDAQFPHSGWLPKNITLGTMDIFKPVPEPLCGQYDVVHVGLLVLVVEKGDPLPILDSLLALLKRGGYLQWDDADYGGSWVRELKSTFTQRGLAVVYDTLRTIPDDIATPWTLNHMLAAYELINVLDEPKGSANEWRELYERAVAEAEQGVTMRMGMISIVGQKTQQAEV